jgi:predicted TIM-barrel fold metal-dependent hydrolase
VSPEETPLPDRLLLVSADGHAGPPIAGYRPYRDPEFVAEYDDFLVAREAWRRERNRSAGLGDDDELVHALFGKEMVDSYQDDDAVSGGGARGIFDSAVRNAQLEREGIVAEVLFPDFQNSNEPPWGAAFPFPDTSPRHRTAGARAFNRWLAEFCGELPGRRAGMAIVHTYDLDAAVAEVRWARGAGLASVMLPTGLLDVPSYHDRRYDAVWAACVDEGLPVTFHSGGTPWHGYGPHAMWVTKMEFMWWARRPLWELIFGGVFERFPDLQVVFTEQGADWIPDLLDRMDEQWSSPFERGIKDHLPRSPSEYWRTNGYVGASFMSRGEAMVRDRIGVDRIMWGADYPHIEGTWPRSLDAMRDALVGCTADEIRLMCSETAARVYGFDLAALRPLADEIGPDLGDLVTPDSPPAVTYSPVDYALGKVSGKETGRRLLGAQSGS